MEFNYDPQHGGNRPEPHTGYEVRDGRNYPAPPPLMPRPPIYATPEPVKPHKGLAIAGFCVALVGCIFGLIPLTFIFAFILGALGLVFGLIGRRHGLGKAATILAIVALCLGVIGAVIVNRAVNDVSNTFDCISNSQTADEMDAC